MEFYLKEIKYNEMMVKLTDDIHVSYKLLNRFFLNEDYDFYNNIKKCDPFHLYDTIKTVPSNDAVYTDELSNEYDPIFEFLVTKNILSVSPPLYGETVWEILYKEKFVKELDNLYELTCDMCNNMKSYERDCLVNELTE